MYHSVMVAGLLRNTLYETGVLNCVEPYDQIMSDRGFTIRERVCALTCFKDPLCV